MSKIQTNYTDGLECPHCGYIDTDLGEIFDKLEECINEYECANCGKIFVAERTCSFTLTGTIEKSG